MRKYVMITGASSGIGAACALHLDRLGYAVLAGVRREVDADALRRQGSQTLTPLIVDVTNEDAVAQAAEFAAKIVGEAGLAGLVNNAGVAVGGPIEAVPLDALRKQLEVNVVGTVAVTQACLPLLRRARGRVVNMGSISGRFAFPLLGPYAASKFALEALTDCLRMELKQAGIFVSIIEPGAVATPIWDRSDAALDAVADAFTEHQHAEYDTLVHAMRHALSRGRARGISVTVVAQAVAHALSARRPRTRYLVGRGARLMSFLLGPMPDRMRDRIRLRWFRRHGK